MCMNLLFFIMFYHDHNGEGCFRQSTQCILDMYIPMERKIKTALKQVWLFFLFCGWLHAFKFQFEDFQAWLSFVFNIMIDENITYDKVPFIFFYFTIFSWLEWKLKCCICVFYFNNDSFFLQGRNQVCKNSH